MELNFHSEWSLHKYIFVILFLGAPVFTYIEHSVAEDFGNSQQNCRAFDLSRRIPQRDQGRVGWCGAYAVASLASFHQGEEVSAAALAVLTHQQSRLRTQEHLQNGRLRGVTLPPFTAGDGQYLEVLARNLNTWGYCQESRVNSSGLPRTFEIPGVSGSSQFYTSSDVRQDLRLISNPERRPAPASAQQRELEATTLGGQVTPQWERVSRRIFPETQDHSPGTGSGDSQLVSRIRRACGELSPLRRQLRTATAHRSSPQGEIAGSLSEALGRQEPAAIHVELAKVLGGAWTQHSDHAMLVMGREWDSQSRSCRLIIRNSWGTSCPRGSFPSVSCQNGVIRIPESLVYPNLVAVTAANSRLAPQPPPRLMRLGGRN